MSEPFVFDPWCQLCKSPFGAVTCHQSVVFSVRPLAREGFTHCALTLHLEFSEVRVERELHCDGPEGDRLRFSLTFDAPGQPELVWYHFRFWRDNGTGCDLDHTGYRSDGHPDDWQLTVYEDFRPTPRWFGRGITYQIFPDRFCRLTVPDPIGLVGDRTVHENWGDTPEWRPDQNGEVRNRDFFGGSLRGITSRLEYLEQLSVTTLYLCPVFESASNHRYNTADYTKIDPMLGTEEDFRDLCEQAEKHGIRVILDGVFNHTGSNSVYFNADGFFPGPGAAQSQDSPYYSWYSFHPWPKDYDAWWGIRTLPAVNESCSSYGEFIMDGKDSVIRHWLRAGASGWRLDVADELPDEFITRLRAAVDTTKPGSILLAEVWEDGSNKIAYSKRRKYLLGNEAHGLMNYPFRTAALAYLQGGDAGAFRQAMETIRENYPPPSFYSAMNFLGTHDTARILTVLGAKVVPESKVDRAVFCLSPSQRTRALALLHVAAVLLYAFPGSPMIYYGDEAGMEGWEDPFNRRTYPWGKENVALRAFYVLLGKIRRARTSLQRGDIRYLYAMGHGLAFLRSWEDEVTAGIFNAGDEPLALEIPWRSPMAHDALTGQVFSPTGDTLKLNLSPLTAMLLI
jgi:4-alpha-glucanotransferase